jgi:hypothetical protein
MYSTLYNVLVHPSRKDIHTIFLYIKEKVVFVSQHVCFYSHRLAKLPTLVVLYLSPVILDYIYAQTYLGICEWKNSHNFGIIGRID